MLIDNDKKYSISEASKITGFSKHVLRFYEDEFGVEVPRNKSNHRYYTYVEIEKFIYIKTLKERGLSNQQIKDIFNSPEEILANGEVAATSTQNEQMILNSVVPLDKNTQPLDYSQELLDIKKIVGEKLDDNFKVLAENLLKELESKLFSLKTEVNNDNDDKDALISENARLKMKLKERAYESAKLKDKIRKLEQRKGSLFGKLFGRENKV